MIRTLPQPKPRSIFGNSPFALILLFIISLRFFSFQGLPQGSIDAIEFPVFLFLAINTAKNLLEKHSSSDSRNSFFWFSIALLGIPIFTFFPAYFLRDQSFIHSILVQRSLIYWLLYFYLHHKAPSERSVLFAIGTVGAIWAAITIGQQFTYPKYWFLGRVLDNVETPVAVRAGVYRFMIPAPEFAILFSFFCINKFITLKKTAWLVMAIPFLIGIYYFGTRQVMFSAILSIIFLVLASASMNLKKYAPAAVAFGALAAILSVMFWDEVFGEFIQLTLDDASSDNIRVKAFFFFVFDHWTAWFHPLLGNGVAHKASSYGQEIMALKWSGFFQSDIGIFGAFSTYGIFYVAAIFGLIYKGLTKSCSDTKLYLRAFFVYTLVTLPLSAQFASPFLISFYCAVLYLHDKSATSTIQE